MARHPRTRIGRTPSEFQRQAVPIATVMLASMASILPFVATVPIVPPWGLIVFLAWRALHRNIWLPWMGLPLGFWDDLLSGAYPGTAMVLWTAILLAMDMLDRRLVWRDARQEWALVCGWIALSILFTRAIGGGAGDAYAMAFLIPQAVVSMLMFPLVMRLADRLDQWRLRI